MWLRLLRAYARMRRRASCWYSSRVLEASRELRVPELLPKQRELLGQLAELPHWQAFLDYLEIERRAERDNGLVMADDLMKVGEVKGNISRMNKIESDIAGLLEELQETRRKKTNEDDLAKDEDEEQNDDA